MIDYTKFDAALLAEIRRRPRSRRMLAKAHALFAQASAIDVMELPARIFDRRLQALRRAGRIRYSGSVWEAIDKGDCQ